MCLFPVESVDDDQSKDMIASLMQDLANEGDGTGNIFTGETGGQTASAPEGEN